MPPVLSVASYVAIFRSGCPLMLELSLQAWHRPHAAGRSRRRKDPLWPLGFETEAISRGCGSTCTSVLCQLRRCGNVRTDTGIRWNARCGLEERN